MMAETELEEGEAFSSHGDVGDGADIDPFVALSYIDDKIRRCLGHLQKDFEGGITADNLGAKFGGYGSFLPSYQRSPSSWALPEQVHNNTNVGSNVNNQKQVPRKGSFLALDATRKGNVRSGSEGTHSAPNMRYPCTDVPTKDSFLDSNDCGKGHRVMLEPLEKSVSVRESRKLKLRMQRDSARKNAEIYTGLGLDYSSSASSDTSTEETGSLPQESQGRSYESPTSIIQMMTAFPFPEGTLISPLNDKLIRLAEEGNFYKDFESRPVVKDMSVGKLADITLGAKVSKKKESGHLNKNQLLIKSRRENGVHSENDLEVSSKRMGKTGLKPAPIVEACKTRDATNKATKICRETSRDAIEQKLFSSDSGKDEESESDQNHNKTDNRYARHGSKSSLVEKHTVCSRVDNSVGQHHDTVHCSGRTSDQSISHCKDGFAPGLADNLDAKLANEAASNKKVETRKPSRADKQSKGGGRKASAKHSDEMRTSLSEKESAYRKNNDCDLSCKSGTSKSKKDINMAKENYRSSAESNLKPLNSQRDAVVEQRSGIKLKASNQGDNEKDQSRGEPKLQEFDHQAASGTLPPEAPYCGAMAENGQELPKDNWVCCDSCQKWRLLPLGIMTEDLPDHWVCSMLDWLPRMNCDVPEDEATAAVQSLNAASLNNVHDNAGRAAQGYNSTSCLHLDHNGHDKNAITVSDQRKKKHGSREILHAAHASTPRQMLKSKKKHQKDLAKNGGMNDMARSSLPSGLIKTSTIGKINETSNTDNHVDKFIENLTAEGDSKQTKVKRKMEVDPCRTSKKFKSEREYHTKEHRKCELDAVSGEVETSVKKLCEPSQCVPDTRSLETKTVGQRKVFIKRKKSGDLQDSHNLPSLCQGAMQHVHSNHPSVKEPREAEVPKGKKIKMLKSALESSTTTRSNKFHMEEQVNKNVVSSSDSHLTIVKEKARGIEAEKLRAPKCVVTARDTLGGLHSLARDPCLGPVSAEAASRASKISSSHKDKVNLEELRSSQVELPSSSPSRTIKANNLGLLSRENLKKNNDADYRVSVSGSSRQCLEAEGTSGNTQHEATRKEKTTHSRSLGSHVPDFRDQNTPHKFTGTFKVCFKSSRLRNGQLSRDDGVPERKEQHDELDRLNAYNVTNVSKDDCMHGVVLDTQKSVHACSLQSKEKDVKFCSHSDKEEIKPSNSLAESEELYIRKKSRYVGNTRSQQDTPDRNGVKSIGKDRIHMGGMDTTEQRVTVERAEGQSKGGQQQHLNRSFVGEFCDQAHRQKTSTMPVESKVGMSQCVPNHEGKQDPAAWSSSLVPGSSKDAEFDASKVLTLTGYAADQCGPHKRSGSSASNETLVRNTDDTAHISKDSFGQSKNPLKEAEDLRAYADRLKNSGFLCESAEVYFQAALNFLQSASFLEAGNSGSNSHGKLTPMQMYSTTAKLCESCVHEYERLGETAAAALAYKCMEVAYMKIVYCKHLSANRSRNELQATIQMVPQGESPSSSASDLDNLNNQGSIEKTTLCKGSAPHIFGSQIPATQNRNFSRLLDFTQDVTSAMEASMKSQDAFTVASVQLEEANRKEAVAAVKRALDFSFQDVEELVKLLNHAKDATSR